MLRLAFAFVLIIGAVSAASAQDTRVVPQSSSEITLSFAPIVQRAAPAVVNVQAARAARTLRDDPFMRRFFGLPQRGPKQSTSLGSGVIVSDDGIVVTNEHVIRDATSIRVSLNDRREYPATVLLTDERTDLAVLKIEGDVGPFPTLTFGDPDTLEVGDIVLAIGNPFGVGQTVTQGIVSATARTQVGVSDYRFFIQTDAAINPGNSGGALIDMKGRLIGINTAIYSRSGGSNGIGFAIPADMVGLIATSAATGQPVRRPWLGAQLQNVDRELAAAVGLERPVGVLAVEVIPGSPAADGGLQVADVIVGVGDDEVTDMDSFGYQFATLGTSGATQLTVVRDGKPLTLDVRLEAPPETVPRDARYIRGPSPFDGATALNLSPAVADELNIDMTLDGVVIAEVEEGSLAARVGLAPGDRVVDVNGVAPRDTDEFERLVRRRKRLWDVSIERGGRVLNLRLRG